MARLPKKMAFSKREVGAHIRLLRDARGLSQVKLAEALGVAQSNVSEMERGVRTVTANQAVRLATVLRVSVDEILVPNKPADEPRIPPQSLKLLRRLQRIEALPDARQRVVLKVIDALVAQEADKG